MKNSYLSISWLRDGHTNIKLSIDWIVPLSIALFYLLINLSFIFFDKSFIFFESKSFDKSIGLFQILPGFYIAALAAIVSINPKENLNPEDEGKIKLKTRTYKLDDVENSRLKGYIDGKKRTLPIRLLLTRGLAYLAITSLFLIVFSILISYLVELKFFDIFKNNIISCLPSLINVILTILDTIIVFFISQIISITFFLTKFLGDELNRT